jgi:hypothetical protein
VLIISKVDNGGPICPETYISPLNPATRKVRVTDEMPNLKTEDVIM